MLPPASYQLNICNDTRKRTRECCNFTFEVVLQGTSMKANGAKQTAEAVQ